MQIRVLSPEVISQYTDYIGHDMAENIGRPYYRGLVATEGDEKRAGLVWEYKDIEREAQNRSCIEFFRSSDAEASKLILAEYREMITEYGVKSSSAVIPVKNAKEEKAALKEAGFSMRLSESDDILVSLSELSAMPLTKKYTVSEEIQPIRQITVRKFKRGIAECVERDRKGVCEDLSYLPMGWFDMDVSCCYETDDTIKGFLLFHKLPSGILSIQLMLCIDEDPGKVIPGMMRFFISACEEIYSPDQKIRLNRHNEASFHLTEYFLPRGFGIPVYAGSRKE